MPTISIPQKTSDEWFQQATQYESEGKHTMAQTALQAALRLEQQERLSLSGNKPRIKLNLTLPPK